MKKHLKLIASILALVLMFSSLAACAKKPVETPPDDPTPPASEAPVETGLDRGEYKVPDEYTKLKIFDGTYGFGDAEIQAAMNEDESAFYFQFVCFDEDQIVAGTVENGICKVSFDLTGFMSGDAQLIYDDAVASSEPWQPLTGKGVEPPAAKEGPAGMPRSVFSIPEAYTKVKVFDGTYGFGDAEIIAAMNEDESAFYFVFTCFDEDQIVEGTVENGICKVSFDKTGFMSGDAQLIYDDALASAEEWIPLIEG